MERLGIYLRISDDPHGTQTATARQLEDCRAYAARQGWTVADVFEDVDTSAFKRTVKRPEFERMLAAVREGAIDGVLAWKVDRLSRRQRDFVRLDEECETSKGFIATVVEGLDTREATGRFVAELLTAQARMESENTSTRVKRAHQQMAKQGRPILGGTRAFGYSKDRKGIVAEEAVLIREAVERIFAGAGLRGIALDWQTRGVKSPTGRPWKVTPLKRMLTHKMLAGVREYEGTTTEGTWPAILTREESIKVATILSDPLRRKSATNARSYLLSGFLRCGRCGSVLVARPREDHARRYVCGRGPGLPNCGKLARLADPVEQVVVEAAVTALEGASLEPYLRGRMNGDEAAVIDSIREDEATVEQLTRDYYVDKVITRQEFFSARAAVQARLETNRARLASHRSHAIMTAVGAGAEVRKQWPTRSLEWKRAILAAVLDHVVLLPAIKGLNKFDPELVEIVWRA
jgi:DNA invertase Pin-like site-specific DNA recombinase